MQLETNSFPSDQDGAFGSLSRELCKALHKASEHPDHAALLDEFLKFSGKKLKEAKQEYKTRAALYAKREQDRLEKEAAAEKERLEKQYKKNETVIGNLTDENKVIEDALKEEDDG